MRARPSVRIVEVTIHTLHGHCSPTAWSPGNFWTVGVPLPVEGQTPKNMPTRFGPHTAKAAVSEIHLDCCFLFSWHARTFRAADVYYCCVQLIASVSLSRTR